jgi:FkbM family methyltransferase
MMVYGLKKLIKSFLPDSLLGILRDVRNKVVDIYAQDSYSQEGEDRILYRIFERQSSGFYVDVGAHHPKRFSNTYIFYKRGWRGINIDAMPGSMQEFKKLRPRDTNIECAIAKEQKELTFFMFNEPALNSFDKELSLHRSETSNYVIIEEKKIQTKTLEEILMQFLPDGKKIDFLSVDVEGFDLEVLQSNNWNRFKPTYILVECLDQNDGIEGILQNDVYKYLIAQGYVFFAKTFNTVIFKAV